MDATQPLRDAENSLRDFIAFILSKDKADWIDLCGVSPERISKWKERKLTDTKRQRTGVVDERLIYYADFYDIKTILKKNWTGEFSNALGEWKTFEVYLEALENLRDADAHRRELLPHQKYLAMGISGEIRSRIVRYRSKMETPEDCFPRIESARDSLGNLWVPSTGPQLKMVSTNCTLRPDDILEFVVTASDPDDLPLEYCLSDSTSTRIWQTESTLQHRIEEKDIGKLFVIELFIRSSRSYHGSGAYDDKVQFFYTVLPQRN